MGAAQKSTNGFISNSTTETLTSGGITGSSMRQAIENKDLLDTEGSFYTTDVNGAYTEVLKTPVMNHEVANGCQNHLLHYGKKITVGADQKKTITWEDPSRFLIGTDAKQVDDYSVWFYGSNPYLKNSSVVGSISAFNSHFNLQPGEKFLYICPADISLVNMTYANTRLFIHNDGDKTIDSKEFFLKIGALLDSRSVYTGLSLYGGDVLVFVYERPKTGSETFEGVFVLTENLTQGITYTRPCVITNA